MALVLVLIGGRDVAPYQAARAWNIEARRRPSGERGLPGGTGGIPLVAYADVKVVAALTPARLSPRFSILVPGVRSRGHAPNRFSVSKESRCAPGRSTMVNRGSLFPRYPTRPASATSTPRRARGSPGRAWIEIYGRDRVRRSQNWTQTLHQARRSRIPFVSFARYSARRLRSTASTTEPAGSCGARG